MRAKDKLSVKLHETVLTLVGRQVLVFFIFHKGLISLQRASTVALASELIPGQSFDHFVHGKIE